MVKCFVIARFYRSKIYVQYYILWHVIITIPFQVAPNEQSKNEYLYLKMFFRPLLKLALKFCVKLVYQMIWVDVFLEVNKHSHRRSDAFGDTRF